MRYIFLGICYVLPFLLYGQLHDNTWLSGYNNNLIAGDKFGISVLTFTDGSIQINENNVLLFNFDSSNASFSDSSGKILNYSNAVYIGNADWEIIAGSDSLTNQEASIGGVFPQLILALPAPDNETKTIYICQDYLLSPIVSVYGDGLKYAVVDTKLNNGLGAIIARDSIITYDSLEIGKITATRHANGRDWWIVVNEVNTNRFYQFLLSPEGCNFVRNQTIGLTVFNGLGQAVFSPDGAHYAIYNGISATQGTYIDVYDFDRGTGLLSNHRQYHFLESRYGGVAFSPSSRYLYAGLQREVYQYDMQAADLWASRIKVADWDGFNSPYPTRFGTLQLAPDGKIYISTSTGTNVLHVIHSPDEPGLACQLEQHGITLPTYNSPISIPNFPNYRLGPLDSSPGDTLGIDNHPVAWYRYQQDTIDVLHVDFHDLSYYEPTTWSWDFGDGSTASAVRHPVHEYAQPGAYEVCLTVSNINGSSSHCKKLFLGVTAQENPVLQAQIQVGPNPFRERLSVALNTQLRSPQFRLFDALGRLVAASGMVLGINEIDTHDLKSGMYFWEVLAGSEVVKTGKVVKMD